jgi:hypothetical protein
MHQHRMGKGRVEGAIGEGESVDIGNLEARVHHSARSAQGTRLLHLFGLEVDADNLAGGHRLGES